MSKKPTIASGRKLGQKIKKKRIKPSSRRWLERHLNDPYVQRSKHEGYRSRAAFKLLEIDEKHKILKGANRIIDLGAAPGGWSQIASNVTSSSDLDPKVFAIDFLDMDQVPGVSFLKMDFLDDDAPDKLMTLCGSAPNLVLSDMAAPPRQAIARPTIYGQCICVKLPPILRWMFWPKAGIFCPKHSKAERKMIF